MSYIDDKLKKTLAKMLPQCIFENDELYIFDGSGFSGLGGHRQVRETELLHLCWLVEKTLNEMESADYAELLRPIAANYKLLYHASWQQRVVALAKAKGVELKDEGE